MEFLKQATYIRYVLAKLSKSVQINTLTSLESEIDTGHQAHNLFSPVYVKSIYYKNMDSALFGLHGAVGCTFVYKLQGPYGSIPGSASSAYECCG